MGSGSQPYHHSISYNSTTDTYTYTTDFVANAGFHNVPTTSYAFSPADRDAANSSTSVTAYQATDSSGNTRLLRLGVLGATNPTIALTYTNLGYFSYTPATAPSNTAPSTNEFFVFGMVTPITNLPTSGTGTYSGINQGLFYDAGLSRLYQTNGSTSISVNFANGQGTVNFSFTGVDINNAANTLALQSFTGPLSASYNAPSFSGPSSFSSSFTGPSPTLGGTLAGNFFGPSGQEFGFTYLLGSGGPTGKTAWGASVGKQ